MVLTGGGEHNIVPTNGKQSQEEDLDLVLLKSKTNSIEAEEENVDLILVQKKKKMEMDMSSNEPANVRLMELQDLFKITKDITKR